ncbi:MAG: alpha/beta fold hydrolase [Geopsychrobacter sp.]|nr:alpha/beta fold hydrolase [Geopsychrobacter sp.]
MKSVTATGHRYALLDRGDGDEAVILIHGITTYSFIWRQVLPFLMTDRRLVAFDLLGCGGSDMPLDVGYSLAEHAERLLLLVQQLGIKRLHLVGHDVGGGIAQIFAVRYPEMVIDLSLINSVAYDYWPVQPITTMRTPILRHFAMATLDIGAFGMIVRRGLYHKDRLDPELLELFSAPVRSSIGRKAFLHFARCLDNRNLTEIADDLCNLKIPVLLLRGEADVYLSEEISLRLKRDIPGCRLLKIPTGGHYIQEDEPEKIAVALDCFWRGDVVAGAVA